MPNIISKLGELNPQLFREIKGRLKVWTFLLAAFLSFLAQLIFFPNFIYSQSPDIYNWLSAMVIIAILVGGTYTLMNDLATEERRGTLNFIRLSPQSSQSIFVGKMLGVPINIYITILFVIPLHLLFGLKLDVPLHQILISYIILIAASIFYYSGAILFSLVGSWLGGVQTWLGSGFMLIFLLFFIPVLMHPSTSDMPFLISLINPQYYMFMPESGTSFYLKSFVLTAGFSLLVYSIGTYFIWQSIQRCYHDTNATMLSKKQSYLLTTTFTVITLGCANSPNKDSLFSLIFFNFVLFLYLIAALTPNYQIVIDWARYQHIYRVKHPGKQKLIKDLIWGEKSPAILAIAINALIPLISISVFISPLNNGWYKTHAFIAVIFTFSLLLIYAALAQIGLLIKNEQRLLRTNTMMAVLILLPMILSAIFGRFLSIFSILGPLQILSSSNVPLSAIFMLLGLVGHACILGLLVFRIKGRLHKVGESATKALLAENQ
ncbi:hypothetical protein VB620_18885 [Nodularia harveyana UHCC-0300]|uniref:ABC transporter permease n=1 Tax=Nodularia harveyana UHCC-0300 TaxID=2974287 RepID=A0ABU5UIV7_9CYAN|nr:hypothetical protein [Nodularia harveyana]MEA5583399.1 hypothetical protein [Nodularia harveyana UHCC-0300]